MLKVHNLPRGSGKTEQFIEALRQDPTAIGISTLAKYTHQKLYPEDLWRRIYTVDDLLTGRLISSTESRSRKLKIDEGLNGTVNTARLFYELGSQGWDVEVWGSERWL